MGSCLDTGIDPKVLSTSKEENIPFVYTLHSLPPFGRTLKSYHTSYRSFCSFPSDNLCTTGRYSNSYMNHSMHFRPYKLKMNSMIMTNIRETLFNVM